MLAFLAAATIPATALDRGAISLPLCDLHVMVDPAQHALSVEGTVEVRNISGRPQSEAALQISSSLRWLSITIAGEPAEWLTQSYTSDIDHTGQLSEAIVKLVPPLAPGQSRSLRVRYSGTVTRDATRLERIGTPPEIARRSDWDRIGPGFTALRGAGYVAWYPVSMEAASLSQGSEVDETLRGWRERQASAVLRVTVSRAGADEEPAEAFRFVGNGSGESSGATLSQEFTGVEPVLVLFDDAFQATDHASIAAYFTKEHSGAASEMIAAAEAVLPPLKGWFGPVRCKLVIVELADPEAMPYESGSWYFTPLKRLDSDAARQAAQLALARPAARASVASPRPWIREGLAAFAQALIREQQAGRDAALAYLGQFSAVLARAEAQYEAKFEAKFEAQGKARPEVHDKAEAGQPLISTADELVLRAKGAYVWWMLRDQLGEGALQSALAAYRAADDRDAAYMQRLLEAQLSPRRELHSFFDDWVYRDRGLPRLRLLSAYTRTTLHSQTVTAVTVENLGDAGCEVPVMVRSSSSEGRQRLFVPARGKATIRIPLDGAPAEATVNDGSVPEADAAGHTIPVTLMQSSAP